MGRITILYFISDLVVSTERNMLTIGVVSSANARDIAKKAIGNCG
jgi:hypothetical protein